MKMLDDLAPVTLVERIARMEERMATLSQTLEEMRAEQKLMAETIARASGGLKVVLMLGGVAGLVTVWRSILAWLVGAGPHGSGPTA